MTSTPNLPTLLARARRNKRPVVFFRVRTLDEVASVIEASDTTRKPAVVVLDTTEPLPYSIATFVSLSNDLITRAQATVLLAVAVHANHHAISQVVNLPVEAIIPIRHKESKEQYAALVAWTLRTTSATSQRVILDLGTEHDEVPFFASLGLHDILAARINILSSRNGSHRLRGVVLEEISTTLRLPLIASSSPELHAHAKSLPTRRIAGTEDFRGLSEAYTAGLRTALHDRSLSDSARYSAKARRAAVNYAISQIDRVCTT